MSIKPEKLENLEDAWNLNMIWKIWKKGYFLIKPWKKPEIILVMSFYFLKELQNDVMYFPSLKFKSSLLTPSHS